MKESTNTSLSYVWLERLLFLAILSLFFVRSCHRQAQTTLTEQTFVKTRLNDSLTIYTQGQQIAELKDLTKKLRIDKPKAAIEVVTRTVYKTKIQLGEPIYIRDSVPALVLPRNFTKSERWVSIIVDNGTFGFWTFHLKSEQTEQKCVRISKPNKFYNPTISKSAEIRPFGFQRSTVRTLNNMHVKR